MVKITESFLEGFFLTIAVVLGLIVFVALRFYADVLLHRIWEWMNK